MISLEPHGRAGSGSFCKITNNREELDKVTHDRICDHFDMRNSHFLEESIIGN